MKLRNSFAAIAVVIACWPITPTGPAAAGQKNAELEAAQKRYLATAETYRKQAADVGKAGPSLPASARPHAKRLAGVLNELADIKVGLADAIRKQDWSTEEQLEKRYYRLKAEEAKLWDAVERAK